MPGDTPMPFDAAPFDPIKHPLREEALRWWDAGYARQATLAYGKRPPSPFADFFRGFVAGRDTLRRPVAESVDAAIAALDVEVEIDLGRGETFHTILGLDAVRAAHRAEVERAVAEEREACAKACAGRSERHRTTNIDDIGESYELGYRCDEARDCAAAIRARGVAQQRTGSEAPSASDEEAKS